MASKKWQQLKRKKSKPNSVAFDLSRCLLSWNPKEVKISFKIVFQFFVVFEFSRLISFRLQLGVVEICPNFILFEISLKRAIKLVAVKRCQQNVLTFTKFAKVPAQRNWSNQMFYVGSMMVWKQCRNFVQPAFKFLAGIFAPTVIAPSSFEIIW